MKNIFVAALMAVSMLATTSAFAARVVPAGMILIDVGSGSSCKTVLGAHVCD